MRMMFNFEPVPRGEAVDPVTGESAFPGSTPAERALANVAPDARTHGDAVTLQPAPGEAGRHKVGELPWELLPVPRTPAADAGEPLIPPRSRSDVPPAP